MSDSEFFAVVAGILVFLWRVPGDAPFMNAILLGAAVTSTLLSVTLGFHPHY